MARYSGNAGPFIFPQKTACFIIQSAFSILRERQEVLGHNLRVNVENTVILA